MAWAKFDDQFYNHPKLAALGPYALACVGLHTMAICYASAYLTDGFIPSGQVAKLAGDVRLLLQQGDPFELVEWLLKAELWEEAEAGYVIHDYLKYNPSRREVLKVRKDRAKSGQAGGLAKAKQLAIKGLPNDKQKSAPSPAPSSRSSSEASDAASNQKEPFTLQGETGFQVAPSILEALDKCDKLGKVPALRSPKFWKAMIRAHDKVDFGREILLAEAFLVTHPGYEKYTQFLGNWFKRAARDAKEM